MLLGNRLKELRKERGLSQQALGDMINVTKVSICCYEKNTRTPNLETLLDLCEALGTNVSYLLGQDVLAVAESEEDYKVYLDKEELAFLKELKKHKDLYYRFMADPKRTIELVELKLK